MATVRMKKGDKYADIFDSPETIKQAQRDGYSIVEKSAGNTRVTNKDSEEIKEPSDEVGKLVENEEVAPDSDAKQSKRNSKQ